MGAGTGKEGIKIIGQYGDADTMHGTGRIFREEYNSMYEGLQKDGGLDVSIRNEIVFERGVITGKKNKFYSVSTSMGMVHAKRAYSCLIEPEIEDTVIISMTPEDECYVTAILDRGRARPAMLSFEDDVAIRTNGGNMRLEARSGVQIACPQSISLCSHEFEVAALEGDVSINRLSFVGELFQSNVGIIKIFARAIDLIVERFVSKANRSYRYVDGHEQIKAGSYECSAQNNLRFRGKVSQFSAEEDVIIDGKHVHLA